MRVKSHMNIGDATCVTKGTARDVGLCGSPLVETDTASDSIESDVNDTAVCCTVCARVVQGKCGSG